MSAPYDFGEMWDDVKDTALAAEQQDLDEHPNFGDHRGRHQGFASQRQPVWPPRHFTGFSSDSGHGDGGGDSSDDMPSTSRRQDVRGVGGEGRGTQGGGGLNPCRASQGAAKAKPPTSCGWASPLPRGVSRGILQRKHRSSEGGWGVSANSWGVEDEGDLDAAESLAALLHAKRSSVCVYACMCVCVCVCVCTHTGRLVCAICVCWSRLNPRAHTHTHTHIHARHHARARAHTHTQHTHSSPPYPSPTTSWATITSVCSCPPPAQPRPSPSWTSPTTPSPALNANRGTKPAPR